jgi:hypothetical protein
MADKDEFVAYGDAKVTLALAQVKRCRDTNRWSGYPPTSKALKLPAYRRFPGIEP